MSNIEKIINDAWENKEKISNNSDKSIIDTININMQLDTLNKVFENNEQ